MPDPLPSDVADAWAAWLDDGPDEAQTRALARFAAGDRRGSELRAEAAAHVALGVLLAPAGESDAFAAAIVAGLDAHGGDRLASGVMRVVRRAPRRRPAARAAIGAAVAAALAIAALLIARPTAPRRDPPVAQRASDVHDAAPRRTDAARLTLLAGAATADGRRVSAAGDVDLVAGARCALDGDARARLALPDGTIASLAGDAAIALLPGDRLRVERGAAEIAASPRATWTIETPQLALRAAPMALDVDADETWIDAGAALDATVGGRPARLAVGATIAAASGAAPAPATRALDPFAAIIDDFDPCAYAPTDARRRGLPIGRLTYDPPPRHRFASVHWPVRLRDGETGFAAWVRPLRVAPAPGDDVRLALVAAERTCDFVVAEVVVHPGDGWLRLAGEVATARLNWTEPGVAPLPVRPELVRSVSLRAYGGAVAALTTPPEATAAPRRR